VRVLLQRIGATALAFVVNGCAGPAPYAPLRVSEAPADGVLPVLISSELAIGPNRYLFSFTNPIGTTPVAARDRLAGVGFTGPNGIDIPPAEATFIWAIEGVSGVYVLPVDFPVAGDWIAHYSTSSEGQREQEFDFSFDVLRTKRVISPGQSAPSVETPTLDSVAGGVSEISTDANPDLSFYRWSIAGALSSHRAFVLAFATPKFCQRAVCGPTLDKLKAVAAAHPKLTFINVEPYVLKEEDGQLQPALDDQGQLQAAPATLAYGLLSEPYVFVVGEDGVVTASFELVFAPGEIESALKDLS
jgi:hypothetical protein